jgi:2-furoyl-CoA dehydrogenase FAD binding subunit
MKPREFDYVRAESVDEATAELAAAGDEARVLAGGLSLVAMLNLRLVEARVLVDISRLEELSYVRVEGDMLEVGAATTQAELMAWDGLGELAPLLHAAMPNIGHYPTRSRGTVCGSLAHADPSSELPLCLATLGGEVILRSKHGRRALKAEDFQEGPLTTACAADELIVAARFPLPGDGVGHGFAEVARRRGDFAIVAVAASVSGTGIRIGVGGVADHPAVREWEALDGDALDDALNRFAWELGGYDDIHATAKYRRQLVRRLGRRVVEEANACRN